MWDTPSARAPHQRSGNREGDYHPDNVPKRVTPRQAGGAIFAILGTGPVSHPDLTGSGMDAVSDSATYGKRREDLGPKPYRLALSRR